MWGLAKAVGFIDVIGTARSWVDVTPSPVERIRPTRRKSLVSKHPVDLAGEGLWISTDEWLFIDPPIAAADHITAPVVMPEATAIKAILADMTRSPSRIITDYALTPGEIRKWRWVAFQRSPNTEGRGVFPWEASNG